MKQLIQSYKTGELGLFEVPPPICNKNGVLIQTTASLVSAGTEKMIVDIAKKSLIGKAKARPDLVKQVIVKMKQEGIKNTVEKVFNKLDTPIPLGYSCAGKVIEVGQNISGISINEKVACGGAGYANHSEINYIPKNLFVKIPDNVDDIDACFVTVGSIALQGIRQLNPTLGEKIAVIGLGLIGQLTVQILKSNGCSVLGVDIDADKLSLAQSLGADNVCKTDEIIDAAFNFSNGYGVDGVIITASTSGNQPIIDAGEISRHKGKVVVVGMVGMDIPRNLYYKKELEVKLSMAYGPGRYDPDYEEAGIDYPYAYVRWTEQRNFQAFLELIKQEKVTPKKLITHCFDFDDALKAYELLERKEKYIGIVLKYKDFDQKTEKKTIEISNKYINSNKINIGLIGAGNFAKSVILPNLTKLDDIDLVALCTSTGVSSHSTGIKYGFKYITAESNEIFNNKEVNTVFVTTRHDTHSKYVIEAIKNGKNVFIEKPLCIKEDELEEINEIYNKIDNKPIIQVGFNRRFSPFVQKAKEIIKKLPISINYRINAGQIPISHWIQDKQQGGGRIIGEVCHFIDTCSYITESKPEKVAAFCIRKDDKSIPDEDNVSILIQYENGSIATINYFAYGNKQLPKEYIEIFANNISIQLNDFKEFVLFKGNKKENIKKWDQDKGFKNEFESFKLACKTGVPAINFESIYLTTKATFKILESLRTNKIILIK